MSGRIATFLRETLKLNKGDKVGIISPNSTLYTPVVHGVLRAGCVCVTLNPIYSAEELEHPLIDSDIKVMFSHPVALKNVLDAMNHLKRPLTLPNGQNAVWLIDEADSVKPVPSGQRDFRECLPTNEWPVETVNSTEDLSFIVYSSGTSGKPKGVMLSHDNLISNTETFRPVDARESASYQTMLAVLPFFHIFGLNFFVFTCFLHGIRVVAMPKFDINLFCASVQRFQCTMALVVPPILLALARHPVVDKYDMSTLRLAVSGAAPLGPELCEDVTRRLPTLGLGQGYGLSETSPVILRATAKVHHGAFGTAGRIVPHNEVRLVDYDGKDVAFEQGKDGKPGELWVRGRNVMKGYLNNKAATEDCLTPDGWFKTGDVAIVKNGNFFIVDRMKELIKYKGFQVSPAELEDLLLGHPKVADCAVVGQYVQQEATELPRAYIVPKPNVLDPLKSSPAEKESLAKEIIQWTDSKVANHKRLRGGVEILSEIPKSTSGKILRRFLRDKANGK